MNSKTIAYGILRAIAIIVGVLVLLWFLYKIQSILLYITFAAVILFLLYLSPLDYFLVYSCYSFLL